MKNAPGCMAAKACAFIMFSVSALLHDLPVRRATLQAMRKAHEAVWKDV